MQYEQACTKTASSSVLTVQTVQAWHGISLTQYKPCVAKASSVCPREPATKPCLYARDAPAGQDMPGGNGRDQGASSGSASSIRPPTSSTASASAAARSSSRNTLPVTASLSASLSRGPTSAGAPMSRGTLAPTTASSIAAGPDRSGGHVLGGMPEGAGREGAAGEALQALDQLARTNPSLYAALSAIDESPPTHDGDLSEGD